MAERKSMDGLTFNELRTLELKVEGRSMADIAVELGYKNASGAQAAYVRALRKYKEELEPEVQELRTSILVRVERLLETFIPVALNSADTDAFREIIKAFKLLLEAYGIAKAGATVNVLNVSMEVTDDERVERVAQLIDAVRSRGDDAG